MPGHLPAIIHLIDVFNSLKKLNEAEKLCTKFTNVAGNNIEIISRLGVIRNTQERYTEAIELFDQVLLENPVSINALMNKGLALQFTGKLNEAVEIFNQASHLAPNVQNVWHILALAQMANYDMEKAIISFEKAFQINIQ